MFEGKEPPFAAEVRFSTSVGRGAFPTNECSLTTATGVYDGNTSSDGWRVNEYCADIVCY